MSRGIQPRCVLVIDDEAAVREVIQGCLEDIAEWQVFAAGSGREGLLIAASEQPQAILLDVSMPEMDGIETFQKLQENPVTQTIPVILLTARVQPQDRAQFSTLGVAGVIIKPFDPMTLVDEIAELLSWET